MNKDHDVYNKYNTVYQQILHSSERMWFDDSDSLDNSVSNMIWWLTTVLVMWFDNSDNFDNSVSNVTVIVRIKHGDLCQNMHFVFVAIHKFAFWNVAVWIESHGIQVTSQWDWKSGAVQDLW